MLASLELLKESKLSSHIDFNHMDFNLSSTTSFSGLGLIISLVSFSLFMEITPSTLKGSF